ncbi:MAG TPA: hypothetical protein VL308_16100 [Gemmatimonadaceae bacterium]|jgi:carbonic anhydrase|nr:hypothetical protein [Gemmatimonadaceae bacterium]
MVSAFNRRPSPVRHRRLFPYTEGVRWVVIAPPIDLSKGQTAAFAALFPEGNSRHVQPVNGRHVSTDDSHFERDEGVPANRIH